MHNSHQTDQASHLTFAMDLMPLLKDPELSPKHHLQKILSDFSQTLLDPFS